MKKNTQKQGGIKMKLTKAVKKAYTRGNLVADAKAKQPDELTREEAIEVVKWDKEADRNNSIVLSGVIIYLTYKALKK